MIPYIIGIILLIIALLITGLILRKKIYDAVDRQEMWKMDIMNRNTAAELARIKGLNLSGETQERFEAWKERWEFIVASELPIISEKLFEAEDAADRYRFRTARKINQKIDQKLNVIEKDIERMLGELNELLESEQTSRKEIEILQPKLEELHQYITQNRSDYGKSVANFFEALSEIEKGPLVYKELVEAGNYLEAKEFVDQLQKKFEKLEAEAEEFPVIFRVCTDQLPGQLDELMSGMKTMKDEEYRIGHLGFEQEIQKYHQRLLDCVQSLGKGSVEEVKVIIAEIEERITEMYELLEREAIAKNYIETQFQGYQTELHHLIASFGETKAEVETLRKAYFFEDQDMEKYLLLDKAIVQAKNGLDELIQGLEDQEQAHLKLRMNLEEERKRVEDLKQQHNDFKEKIQTLRKDELEAKAKLADMYKEVNDLKRRLKQGNLPGIPNFIWDTVGTALKCNDRVEQALEKQPLDIAEVSHALTKATEANADAEEQIDMMLDQAYLTEQVIQYANRYRSQHPILAAQLLESERLFRAFEYELALEHAAKAIEEIEPGALKKIEANQVAMLS